jgi:hypothetical protein
MLSTFVPCEFDIGREEAAHKLGQCLRVNDDLSLHLRLLIWVRAIFDAVLVAKTLAKVAISKTKQAIRTHWVKSNTFLVLHLLHRLLHFLIHFFGPSKSRKALDNNWNVSILIFGWSNDRTYRILIKKLDFNEIIHLTQLRFYNITSLEKRKTQKVIIC